MRFRPPSRHVRATLSGCAMESVPSRVLRRTAAVSQAPCCRRPESRCRVPRLRLSKRDRYRNSRSTALATGSDHGFAVRWRTDYDPSLDNPTPRTTAAMGSPSRCASAILRSVTMAAPSEKTTPSAFASKGRQPVEVIDRNWENRQLVPAPGQKKPPATTASALPSSSACKPRATEYRDDAHAASDQDDLKTRAENPVEHLAGLRRMVPEMPCQFARPPWDPQGQFPPDAMQTRHLDLRIRPPLHR